MYWVMVIDNKHYTEFYSLNVLAKLLQGLHCRKNSVFGHTVKIKPYANTQLCGTLLVY